MRFILFILIFISKISFSQNHTDLFGYRLGQFRECLKNELGDPIQKVKLEDGYEYEVFLLKPDTSLYMIAEFAVGKTDVIWSLQLAGRDHKAETGFKNLKLGDTKDQIEKILGNPSSKVNAGEYGERWEYESANYSVEINPKGVLSSIKIKDKSTDQLPDAEKLPSFKSVVSVFQSKSNQKIADLLAPGLEIYLKDRAVFFQKSIQSEINVDYSSVFSTIAKLSIDLDKIDTKDSKVYEESMRLSTGHNPLHVIKIKSGHMIKEIVFEYLNGDYKIWEIKTNK